MKMSFSVLWPSTDEERIVSNSEPSIRSIGRAAISQVSTEDFGTRLISGPFGDFKTMNRPTYSEPSNSGYSVAISVGGSEVARIYARSRSASASHPISGVHVYAVDYGGETPVEVMAEAMESTAAHFFTEISDILTVTATARRGTVLHTALAGRYRYVDSSHESVDSDVFEYTRHDWKPEFEATSKFLKIPTAYFHTSSSEKLSQYNYLFRFFGIELREPSDELPEKIEPQVNGVGDEQERAVVEIALDALESQVDNAGIYPFVIEDTMLFIEHFNREYDKEKILPGPDTKRWWRALGSGGVLELMEGSTRRRARYVCQLGVIVEPGVREFFRASIDGSIASRERSRASKSPYTNSTFFHTIFVPEGSRLTLGEMGAIDYAKSDYRTLCMTKAADVLRMAGSHASKNSNLSRIPRAT
jgi:inosine/xanthosine triphosphate pyrophosphatase family protein